MYLLEAHPNLERLLLNVRNLVLQAYLPAYLVKRFPNLYVPLIIFTAATRIGILFFSYPFYTYHGIAGRTAAERLLWSAQVMIYICGNQLFSNWYWAPETMMGIQTFDWNPPLYLLRIPLGMLFKGLTSFALYRNFRRPSGLPF